MFHHSRIRPVFNLWFLSLSCLIVQGCDNDLALNESITEGEVVPDDIHSIEGDDQGCAVHQISEEESAQTVTKGTHDPNGPPMVLFLNRHGGTYYPGSNNSATNRSSIVRGTRNVPAYERGDQKWQELLACVQDQFSRFNALVTDVEPSGGNYIEAVIGGRPGDIGVGSGIAGIAPIDYYNCAPIEKAIGFVFSRNIGSDERVCKVTAHELGHTLSLEHEYLCKDPMTYLTGCGEKSFQDVSARCGTGSPQTCRCRGGRQNTVQALYDHLGYFNGVTPPDPSEDQGPPVAEILSPDYGETFESDSQVEVIARVEDDLWLSRVELQWDHGDAVYGCPTSSQNVTCSKEDNLYVWRINVSEGIRTFRVRALDIASNEVITDTHKFFLTADGTPPPEASDDTPPSVETIQPIADSTLPPNQNIQVVATITDDLTVDKVDLVWDFNSTIYPCPTDQNYVTCSISGDTYTWDIRVGEGERNFKIRARDTAGNVTLTENRKFYLDIQPDHIDPEVTLLEPANEAYLQSNSTITVRAQATDDMALDRVKLIWDYNNREYGCPLQSQYVDCTRQGDEFIWKVDISTGSRTFRVKAFDEADNSTSSESRTIYLSSNGTPPVVDEDAPQIELVTPEQESELAANSTIEVKAQVTDNQAVDNVKLIWDYNNRTYNCPTNVQYVNCTQDGDFYTWRVDVSTGTRTFRIRATDSSDNTTTSPDYTFQLATDDQSPEIENISPEDGTTLIQHSTIEVSADISDNSALDDVKLIWDYNNREYSCPLQSQYVDCSIMGTRYIWTLDVSTGSRTFKIRARDQEGNVTTTPSRTFDLGTPVLPPSDPDPQDDPQDDPQGDPDDNPQDDPVDDPVDGPSDDPQDDPNNDPGSEQPGEELAFITVPAENNKTNAQWGTVLTDIVQHLPEEQTHIYFDHDTVTHGHETSHGIHAHIRNTYTEYSVHDNAFYVLEGRAVIIKEPSLNKSDVGPYVPPTLREFRFSTYVTGQSAWDDTPLYIWDEWNAYVNGAEVGMSRFTEGLWDEGWRDQSGNMEFIIYSLAVGLAVESLDPDYIDANPNFLQFLAWNTRRAMTLHKEFASIGSFQSDRSDDLLEGLQTNADAEELRDFIIRHFGADFAMEVFGF